MFSGASSAAMVDGKRKTRKLMLQMPVMEAIWMMGRQFICV